MNPWLRRIAYLLFVLVWLLLMSFPLIAFSLAARYQLQLGPTEGSHARLFLIQEKDAEGIGVEVARPSLDTMCLQVSVRYFMWKGAAENVLFCQCNDVESGRMLSAAPGVCNP